MTVSELADRVIEERRAAWAAADPSTAVTATEQLNPEDERAVRRVVAEAGYAGEELEAMVKQVSTRVVGRLSALADDLPATGGD